MLFLHQKERREAVRESVDWNLGDANKEEQTPPRNGKANPFKEEKIREDLEKQEGFNLRLWKKIADEIQDWKYNDRK